MQVEEELIRWICHKLLKKEGDGDIVLGGMEHFERHCDFRYCRYMHVDEVKGAIHRMHTELDEISVEV